MHQGTAIVIGAGICGLTTAAVLSQHFDAVVLVERAQLPEDSSPRRGTPQARHVHGLLARGAEHLEALFPGLREELRSGGAPVFDHGSARTQVWAGTLPAATIGIEVQTAHRDDLEAAIRRRVLNLPRVTVRDGTAVEGLHMDADNRRVDGVVISCGGEQELLEAALVVDASGRASRLPDWLQQVRYPQPAEKIVDGGLTYVSRVFEAPGVPGVHGLQQMNQAPDRPGGTYAADIGQDRWLVTLFGAGGTQPPLDDHEWRAYAESLDNPDLRALLADAKPVGPSHQHLDTRNRCRQYDKLPRRPERLVALGDAYCAFNPVYGQGMTVAVLQAVELGKALAGRESLDGLAHHVQRRVARLAQVPWLMATSEDRVWAAVVGGRKASAPLRMTAWYKQRLLYLAVHDKDPAVLRTFFSVFHMLKSPAAMAHPRIMAKVILRARSPHTAQEPASALT
ncbi:FAD-dependent oxidoreductase [Streptomyces iconiensis]|uniref:FAD-dependent monooxygenase n=1 Tax=Streptomyces iconiensis TaxID=1384038 RepID=A0ABT6ZS89_9ACTN|nr:FAD-dependent monooxygenase [Streptomyces iconiensis]MDJ1131920.1 FAD-dependent monooxygenase [Streptomyces iconiensis]